MKRVKKAKRTINVNESNGIRNNTKIKTTLWSHLKKICSAFALCKRWQIHAIHYHRRKWKNIRRSFFVEQGECVFERLQKMTQRKRESQILNPVIFFMTWIGIQGCTFSSLSYHGAVLLRLGTILFVFVLCFFAKGQTIFLFFRLPIKIVSIFISSVQSIRIGLKFKQSSIDTLIHRQCIYKKYYVIRNQHSHWKYEERERERICRICSLFLQSILFQWSIFTLLILL